MKLLLLLAALGLLALGLAGYLFYHDSQQRWLWGLAGGGVLVLTLVMAGVSMTFLRGLRRLQDNVQTLTPAGFVGQAEQRVGRAGQALADILSSGELGRAQVESISGAAGSNEVGQAIEHIAGISAEMNVQVAEVSTSARAVSDMAETLQFLSQKFKLDMRPDLPIIRPTSSLKGRDGAK